METPKKVVLIGDKDHPIVAPSTPDTVASTPSPQRNRNLYHHSSPISPQTNARRQLGGVGGKCHSSPIPGSLPRHLHLSHIQKRLGNKSSRCQQCRSRVHRFIAIYVIVVVSLYNNFAISNRNVRVVSNRSQRVLFRGRPCPTINAAKRQILLLNVGTMRSFIYPTAQEYYYSNQINDIQNTSNAQIHQIWYFSLGDNSLIGKNAANVDFPPVNMTDLQYLKKKYDVPVLEIYNSSKPFPPHFYEREDMYNFFKRTPSGFMQAYRVQLAFEIALEYANTCGVDWTYLIRTRPDYICTSPVQLDLSQYDEFESRYMIHDDSWRYPIADFFYVLDKTAAVSIVTNFTENYFTLPSEVLPLGWTNPESKLYFLSYVPV